MNNIKNIIFDLGGVVLDIDYSLSIKAFSDLKITDAGKLYSKSSQIKIFDELETGLIDEPAFFEGIRKLSLANLSDEQIRNAWNALLIGLPHENVSLLYELKKDHRLFLLSNTNAIHEKAYTEIIIKQYGKNVLEDVFDKIYLSHKINLRKPSQEIFDHVIHDSQLAKSETIFIDDSPQHVAGGEKCGIRSYYLKDRKLLEFFQLEGLIN
jgi:putative hydrolase of the HAD superfamily